MSTIRYRTTVSLLFLAFISLSEAFSQAVSIDSLETALAKHTQIDTAKVNLLNKLAYELHRRNPKKAISYAQQSQKMADQLNYPKGKAAGLWGMGMCYASTNRPLALTYYEQALRLAEQVNDQIGICTYLLAIGNANQVGQRQSQRRGIQQSFNDSHYPERPIYISKAAIQHRKQLGEKGAISRSSHQVSVIEREP